MTEPEWNESINIYKMLNFVNGERKKRLFACACVRQVWHLLEDDRSKQAVIIAEQYADGLGSKEKLHEARKAALAVNEANFWSPVRAAAFTVTAADNAWFSIIAFCNTDNSIYLPLIKDIFDPFNKYKQPQCDNYTKEFARTIYDNPNEKGELLDLHVLADMLIDQNVDQVLADHLRSGIHVRGCQVMDLVMHN